VRAARSLLPRYDDAACAAARYPIHAPRVIQTERVMGE
jgi:hypothetical protein